MAESLMGRIRRFFKEVKAEMQKVTWPSKDEIIGSTIVVITITLLLTLYVGVIDLGCTKLVQLLLAFGGRAG
jgi:preprotein translocase subunit SecE